MTSSSSASRADSAADAPGAPAGRAMGQDVRSDLRPVAARSLDAAKLRAIRAALLAISPAAWTRAADDKGGLIEARGAYGEVVVLARFDAAGADEQAFAADAPDMVAFLLRLLDAAFAAIRARNGRTAPAHRQKNYAAECALKCTEFGFQRFLEACHGLEPPATPERAAQKVRSILGVQSRAELNDGGRATAAWRDLRAAYEKHKRATA